MRSRLRWLLLSMLCLLLAAIGIIWFIHLQTHRYDARIVRPGLIDTAEWQRPRVAIVFGAGIYSDGRLSAMLEDRVRTAAELYRLEKVDRILVSGDNRFVDYNEPRAMREYLISHAVDPKDVILDYAGRSTYETCQRAVEIFGVRRAVLVTQKFHLPRALYLANKLGLDSWGVIADYRDYGAVMDYQEAREIAAEVKAFYNLYLLPPATVLGNREPIE